jgi:hypothetical protein
MPDARGEGAPERFGVGGMLEHERALEISRAVKA